MKTSLIISVLLLHAAFTYGKQAIVQEGERAYLTCNTGFSIEVKSASYAGSKGSNCGDGNALTTVQNLADGTTNYLLPASNVVFTTTDCNPGVDHILDVRYQCIKQQTNIVIQNGDTQSITCPTGRLIQIATAAYEANNCFASGVLEIVITACQSKNTCSLTANDATFPGSTCPANKLEKLKITYTCSEATGAVFTRWGINRCPASAIRLYSGVAAGRQTTGYGSTSNYLCLPNDADFTGSNTADEADVANIYGQQITLDTGDTSSPISTDLNEGVIQCAVCQSLSALSTFMMAGETRCPGGWNTEYVGTLGSAPLSDTQAASSEYVCLDNTGDASTGYVASGSATSDGLIGLVESKCGPTFCNYYTNDAELSCVLCSK